MCWIAWKRLTKSKKEGGLGFRDIETFNDALLAKLSWRILAKPNCLLARILKGKYFRNSDFLDALTPSSSSHGWRGLCIGKELLKQKMGMVIGNGKNTNIWYDAWLSNTEPIRPMGPPPQDTANMMVAELLTEEGQWDRAKIRRILPEREHDILCIKPSRCRGEDKRAWLCHTSGQYTTKTGYHVARELKARVENETREQAPVNWRTEVWNYKTSPKLKLFLWKALQGALPLGVNLEQRGIIEESKCARCGERETTEHIFFNCRFAQRVWHKLPTTCTANSFRFDSFYLGMQRLQNIMCLPPIGITNGQIFPWVVWQLWTARNKSLFEEKFLTETAVLLNAVKSAREWAQAQEGKEKEKEQQPTRPRQVLCREVIEIYTDAAWNHEESRAGLGWIFQKQSTKLHQDHRVEQHVKSPLIAEALALREAIRQASDRKLQRICVKSDSLVLIEAINKGLPLLEIYGTLLDISMLSLDFEEITFDKVDRKFNMKADCIAKQALRSFVTEIEP